MLGKENNKSVVTSARMEGESQQSLVTIPRDFYSRDQHQGADMSLLPSHKAQCLCQSQAPKSMDNCISPQVLSPVRTSRKIEEVATTLASVPFCCVTGAVRANSELMLCTAGQDFEVLQELVAPYSSSHLFPSQEQLPYHPHKSLPE